VKQIRWYC